jgi:hypothetical protein
MAGLIAGPGCTALADEATVSGRIVQDSVQASAHAGASAAHGIMASGRAVSAAVAIPLSVSGAVLESAGKVSTTVARDLMRAANAPIGTPLEVTDEVITVMPPNEALQHKGEDKPR